jgi:large subunit ribosomal protein L24
LSKDLKKELGKRAVIVRKGDKVKIVRGDQKKKEGKIVNVEYETGRIFVEKIVRKKADGTEIPIPINTSNAIVVELDQTDEKRFPRTKNPAKTIEKKEAKNTEDYIWAEEKPKPKAEKKSEKKKVE